MIEDRIAFGIPQLNETGRVFGDAANRGAGIITNMRMGKTFDIMVAMKPIDPSQEDVKKTCITQFLKDLRVLP